MDYDDDDEDEDDYNLDQYWDELLSLTWQSKNGHGGGSRLDGLWRQRGWRWRWLQYGPILRYFSQSKSNIYDLLFDLRLGDNLKMCQNVSFIQLFWNENQ